MPKRATMAPWIPRAVPLPPASPLGWVLAFLFCRRRRAGRVELGTYVTTETLPWAAMRVAAERARRRLVGYMVMDGWMSINMVLSYAKNWPARLIDRMY